MRKLILVFFAMLSLFAFSQVKWMTIDEALKAQEIQPRKILIDFYTDSCTPCKQMEKSTYNHPVIADYLNKNFYPVKFNAESKLPLYIYGKLFTNQDIGNKNAKNTMHSFTKFMNVNAVPSIVFLDEQSMPITILQGSLTAKELEPYLPFFIKGDYQKMQTSEQWENYQKKIRSRIKD